jgi:hypothetical protein
LDQVKLVTIEGRAPQSDFCDRKKSDAGALNVPESQGKPDIFGIIDETK